MRPGHHSRAAAWIALTLIMFAARVEAQFPPARFTNLQVLSDSISPRELIAIMRNFSLSLGVRCQYCHVGNDDTPLDSMDFATDTKPYKATARQMLRMVDAINRDHLAGITRTTTSELQVKCITCHRGLPRPVLIQDELTAALAEGGAARAVSRYTELRDRFYGGGSYDFSAETLNEFGATLMRQRRLDEALALITLSVELHPRSMQAHFYQGEALRALGDTAAAVASYRNALDIDPDQQFIRRLIEQLTR